jgi:crotonobetainyl-CoA:carnitine CoA-transferase CaiB-like acyl-CoA transferase
MHDQAPLAGLRVLDLTTMIAGPTSAQILADYGAEVIKIEPPEGDLMRRSAGAAKSADMGPLYLQLNRNKRSIVLDLKQAPARDVLLRLSERADVFITNTRPAAMRRLKLASADLHKVNPRLVYVGIMGYGTRGPYADKPAYDDLIQGICAVPSIVVENGGQEPLYAPLTLADRVVGINTAHAILAAVIRRDRTGEGQSVEVPMFETVAQFVLADHLAGRSFDPPTGTAGNPRLTKTARRPFVTKDGHVCALVYTNKHWKAFLEAAGRLDLYEAHPHLIEFASRRRHAGEASRIVADILRSKTTAEALALLERCDIPCAPMNSVDDLIDDPHLAAVGFFETKTHPSEGPIRYLGVPSRWNGDALKITRHAPRVGEHSVAILQEIGLAAAEIDALIASGATVDAGMAPDGEGAPSRPIARKSPMA